ncbi:hypothetical protein HYR69_03140 [Candidatus Sumerlaeota bacterium]|nr:hypothetical protein [Candidatus Sumerlaeota bacterium]
MYSQYAHADQHAIVFHPQWNGSSNQTLYTGCDGGIFKTTNAVTGAVASGPNSGICFFFPDTASSVSYSELNNNYVVTQFYHGRPYPAPTTSYFGGAQDNGTSLGSDAGGVDGWSQIVGGDGGYVSYDPSNTNVLFAETQRKNLLRSTAGSTGPFSDIVSGAGQVTEASGNFAFIVAFRADPANANRLWYGGNIPWRSNNAVSAASAAAVTWTQAGAALGGGQVITAWAIAPGNSNRVYVGTNTGSVYTVSNGLSSTSATTWTNVSPTISGSKFISWLEADANDATGNTVYATNSSFNSGNHIYRSTTAGSSWTNITNNLPDLPTHCVVIQPAQPTNLYAGTDLGLFISKNTGGSWASVNSPGFANVVVESLEFQNQTTLYAFTHGRGAWRANVAPTNSARDWHVYD